MEFISSCTDLRPWIADAVEQRLTRGCAEVEREGEVPAARDVMRGDIREVPLERRHRRCSAHDHPGGESIGGWVARVSLPNGH